MNRGSFFKVMASVIGLSLAGVFQAGANEKVTARKLNEIIVPDYDFKGAQFVEVLDFLRLRSLELDPTGGGINIFVLGSERGAKKAEIEEMKGAKASLKQIMDLVAAEVGYTYSVKFGGVVFQPKDYVEKKTPKAEKAARAKLAEVGKIKIPEVSFGNATLEEVAMFLTLRALDLFPEGKSYKITVGPEFKDMKPRIVSFYSAKNVSLDEILDYLCQELDLDYEIKDREVLISSTKKAE